MCCISNHIISADVTEEDILQVIRAMKASKAQDVNGVSPYLVKLAAKALVVPITLIVNFSLLEGKVPEEWKKAKIIPIHKKGSKKDKSNYRPVSILPTFSKILEAVVKRQLTFQMEALGVLPTTQHGFREDHSVTTAAATLEHDIKAALCRGKKAGVVYLDLSAAFDMIDSDIIVERLKIYGATQRVCKWVKSYLTGRMQYVHYQGRDSDLIDNSVGAPQGSVLSPLLFLVLVADMDSSVLGLPGVTLLSYADDTTVIVIADTEAQVRSLLEKAASRLLEYMQASGLAANPEKTHFTVFNKKCQDPISIAGSEIPESKTEKLVGFHISKDMSWKPHIQALESDLRSRIGILRRLSWHLTKPTLIACLNPVFMSKLQGGLELFTNPLSHSNPNMKKCSTLQRLQVIQNEAMRVVLRKKVSDRVTVEQLLSETNQASVTALALRASCRQAWNFFSTLERRKLFKTSQRLNMWSSERFTRQNNSDTFPVKDSLLSRMSKCWNELPIDVKAAESKSAVKAKLKQIIPSVT